LINHQERLKNISNTFRWLIKELPQ